MEILLRLFSIPFTFLWILPHLPISLFLIRRVKKWQIRPLDKLLPGESMIMTEKGSIIWLIFFNYLMSFVSLIFWGFLYCFNEIISMVLTRYSNPYLLHFLALFTVSQFIITLTLAIDHEKNLIMLTDKRIVGMGGRCSTMVGKKRLHGMRSSLDVPLDKMDSAIVELNFLSTITRTGAIILNSGSQIFSFYGFQMPERFKNKVMEQVDLKKKEAAELQMQQQAELAQEQRADAERMAQFQAQAMAQAMLEAQGIAVPPQPQYQMPQNQVQMPQNPLPQMPMMEIPVGGGVQIPVTPQQMQAQIPPQQPQVPPQQTQIPPQEQYQVPPQQTQIPPPVEPSQYVGQRQMAAKCCVACQNELSPNAKFCPACGSPQ